MAELPDSFGVFGSDRLAELPSSVAEKLAIEDLGIAIGGLRFALMARRDQADSVGRRLERGEPLSAVTSNPGTLKDVATRNGYNISSLKIVGGQVEKYPALFDIDVAFDMVETGGSAMAQNLEIVRDELHAVRLCGAWQDTMY